MSLKRGSSLERNTPSGGGGGTGPMGPQGPAGLNGKTVLNGTSDPSSDTGTNGDFYINTSNWTIWGPKAAGAWPTTGVPLIGSGLGGGGLPSLSHITLSANSFVENLSAGTVIATLGNLSTGVTPVLSNNGGGRVALSGNNLVIGSTNSDHDTTPTFDIQFTQTDSGYNNSPLVTTLTLAVNNLNDTNPSAFSFADVSNATVSTVVESPPITVAGLGADDSVTASISGATSRQIAVSTNGGTSYGAWGSGPVAGLVNGNKVKVRVTSSASNFVGVSVTLNLGTTSDTFTVTTIPAEGAIPETTLPTFIFDTSIGQGVSIVNGIPRTNLPPEVGAQITFIDPQLGNDANVGSDPAAPKQTSASAFADGRMRNGHGDMLLFKQGGIAAATIPDIRFRQGGRDLRNPWVFQTYDGADPTNQAKWGAPPLGQYPRFTADTGGAPWAMGGTDQRYVVVRGFDVAPTVTADQSIGGLDVLDGFLLENCIGRHIGFGLGHKNRSDPSLPQGNHWIVRGNSLFNTYSVLAGTAGSISYMDGCDTMTFEANMLHGAGHFSEAVREDPGGIEAGAGSMFRHALYQQDGTKCQFRYNLVTSSCADAGSHRGDFYGCYNARLDCPIASAFGDGTDYNLNLKTRMGYRFDQAYDVSTGSTHQVPGSGAAGWGIVSVGGQLGSKSRWCVMAGSPWGSFSLNVSLHKYDYAPYNETDADLLHSHHEMAHCVMYNWTDPANYDPPLLASAGYFNTPVDNAVKAAKIHINAHDNVWDGASDGNGNVNKDSAPRTNPVHDKDEIAMQAGHADYFAMIDWRKERPADLSLLRKVVGQGLAGFDIPLDPTPAVLTVTAVSGSDDGEIDVTLNLDKEGGMAHVIAIPTGDTVPSKDEIRGRASAGWGIIPDGAWRRQIVLNAGDQPVITLTGLTPGDDYDVIAVHDYYCYQSDIEMDTATAFDAGGSVVVQPTHWDVAGSNAPGNLALSGTDNLRVTSTGSYSNNPQVAADVSQTEGYFEVRVHQMGGFSSVGVTDEASQWQAFLSAGGAVSYYGDSRVRGPGNSQPGNGSMEVTYGASNKVIGVYVDDAEIYFSVNGVWQYGADADARTGGFSLNDIGLGVPVFPAVDLNESGDSFTLNAGATPFAYPIPTGGTSWDKSQSN